MCVIAVVRDSRPSEEQVRLMHKANNHGGGVAWQKDPTTIEWEKGLDLDAMIDRCASLPTPYIAHFRIPTSTTSKDVTACHPFVVDGEASNELSGMTTNSLLFHNGHWNAWRQSVESIAIGRGMRVPNGEWSDTRGLAFLAHYVGEFALENTGQKISLFNSDGSISLFGDGWTKVEGEVEGKADLIVSNTIWKTQPYKYAGRTTLPAVYQPKSAALNSASTEFKKGWGGIESLTLKKDVESLLTEIEQWRSDCHLSSSEFRRLRTALRKRAAELAG